MLTLRLVRIRSLEHKILARKWNASLRRGFDLVKKIPCLRDVRRIVAAGIWDNTWSSDGPIRGPTSVIILTKSEPMNYTQFNELSKAGFSGGVGQGYFKHQFDRNPRPKMR